MPSVSKLTNHFAILLSFLMLLGFASCRRNQGKSTHSASSAFDPTPRSCPPEDVEQVQLRAIDVDRGAGRAEADVSHASIGGKRVCSVYDLNFDGKSDIKLFYGKDGKELLREEDDFDLDGRIDQVLSYGGGQLVRKDLDTNFDGEMDLTLWCNAGAVTRAVRDRWRDGRADTWEEYKDGLVLRSKHDSNNDGKADRWQSYEAGRLTSVDVDTDGDGQVDYRQRIDKQDRQPPMPPIRCEPSASDAERKDAAARAAAGRESAVVEAP